VRPENCPPTADILVKLDIPVAKDSLEMADYPVLVVGSPAEVVAVGCMDRRYMHPVVVVA
jgi:hypothetical protein